MPGLIWPPTASGSDSFKSSPHMRPTAPPMRMHGTKRPLGTAMPYVHTASTKATMKYSRRIPGAIEALSWNMALMTLSLLSNVSVAMALKFSSPHCRLT